MKVYAKHIIRFPNDTKDRDLLVLKSFADIYYTAYNTLPLEQMHPITKVIMDSIRKLCDTKEGMSFAKHQDTGEYALFVFDHDTDGITRTVQKDDNGFYIKI